MSIAKMISGRFNQKSSKAGIGSCLLGLAAAAFVPTTAHAALLLIIDDVTDSASVSPSTATPASGTLAPGLGYANVVVSSNSPGSAAFAQVSVASATLFNTSDQPKTVSLTVADTDYALPGGPGSTLSLVGAYAGTFLPGTAGSVQMTSFADAADGPNASLSPIATTTSTASLTNPFPPLPTLSLSGTTPVAAFSRSTVGLGLYSLAGVTTLVLQPGSFLNLNNNTVTFATTSVPEPTTLALLGAGGLLLMRRRRPLV
jgi:hypothetical protein